MEYVFSKAAWTALRKIYSITIFPVKEIYAMTKRKRHVSCRFETLFSINIYFNIHRHFDMK